MPISVIIEPMKILIIVIIGFLTVSLSHCETIDDIKKKLGAGIEEKQAGDEKEDLKGSSQAIGKYHIVQVKDMSSEEAGRIAAYADRLMQELVKLHDYPFGLQKCYIVVYGIKKDYDRAAKEKHMEKAKAFSYKRGLSNYAVTYYAEDLYPTLAHEELHLFIENIFKNDAPIWLNEGMACYYETSAFSNGNFTTNIKNKGRLGIAKNALGAKEWPEIKDLLRMPYDKFYGQSSSVNYAASWCLIYYLKNKNEEAFKYFMNDLALGKSFFTSIRANYGMDQKELEKDWVSYIEKL